MSSDCATVMIAASESDANLYYATRFVAPDPFVFLEIKGERVMLMSDLEIDRARGQATVDRVLSYAEYERRCRERGVARPGTVEVIHVLLEEHGIRRLLVPGSFPYKHAKRLEGG